MHYEFIGSRIPVSLCFTAIQNGKDERAFIKFNFPSAWPMERAFLFSLPFLNHFPHPRQDGRNMNRKVGNILDVRPIREKDYPSL